MSVLDFRLTQRNDRDVRPDADYVLYWMTASRRLSYNAALQHAADTAHDLKRPLVILEDLRSGHRWDTDRHHRFVLDGMREKADRLAETHVFYYPHVEREAGGADGLVEALAERACLVVTDDYPCDVWPELAREAAEAVPVRLVTVDSCGLVPLAAPNRTFPRAFSFRAWLQKNLRPHLEAMPREHPLVGKRIPPLESLPREVRRRWPVADDDILGGEGLARLPVNHDVAPTGRRGGETAARETLRRFVDERLDAYADGQRHPDDRMTSELSPYLHFGHISAHEVFLAVADREGWEPDDLDEGQGGSKPWWGMSESAEVFLDELVTWREIGFNTVHRTDDYDRYESLPDWARQTIEEHAEDDRPYLYDRETFDAAATHDRVWNAAQNQLRREGWLHNYMRMLWGKKIFEWTETPRRALEIMIELNNTWALDGRDPNSYSGIFWCLGRYDRAWGPEREVYGKIRYMTSESTRRKLRLSDYLDTYAPEDA